MIRSSNVMYRTDMVIPGNLVTTIPPDVYSILYYGQKVKVILYL